MHLSWQEDYGPEGEQIDDPAGLAWAWARRYVSDGDLTQALKAGLLRDIVGNPFHRLTGCGLCHGSGRVCEGRPPVGDPRRGEIIPCPGCVGNWLTPAALGIARRAHDLRDWEALPVLADALQEAGCEDEDVLMHCRGKGRCPGCLGKGGCCNLKDEPGVWGEMHRCALCAGSGWVAAGPHCRGCWCVDMLIGKS